MSYRESSPETFYKAESNYQPKDASIKAEFFQKSLIKNNETLHHLFLITSYVI